MGRSPNAAERMDAQELPAHRREERIMSGGQGLVEHPELPFVVRKCLQRRRKCLLVA